MLDWPSGCTDAVEHAETLIIVSRVCMVAGKEEGVVGGC